MTIGELHYILEGMIEDHGEDAELRIASQPNYPFEYSIKGIVSCTDDPVLSDRHGGNDPVAWLVEGNQLGYFTKEIWNLC